MGTDSLGIDVSWEGLGAYSPLGVAFGGGGRGVRRVRRSRGVGVDPPLTELGS